MPDADHRDATTAVPFATAVRGYDRAQVDAHLARLARQLEEAQLRAQEAEHELSEARRWTAPAGQGQGDQEGWVEPTYAQLGEEAARILHQAGEAATALVRRAEERAQALVAESQQRAAATDRDAKVALDQARASQDRAATEAEVLRRSAEDEGRREAAAMIDDARRTIAAERAAAEERLAALRDHLSQAQQDRDAAVGQLDWLAHQLAESVARLRTVSAEVAPSSEGVIRLP